MMWRFIEEPWQYRVLDRLPQGVDPAQIAQMLKRTPTERLDAVVDFMLLAEEIRNALGKGRAGQ
jgi:hypothetical protein